MKTIAKQWQTDNIPQPCYEKRQKDKLEEKVRS